MSLIFTNYDRTQMCNHTGMLGRTLEDGTRICARCGGSVPPEAETFRQPAGRKARRQTERISR